VPWNFGVPARLSYWGSAGDAIVTREDLLGLKRDWRNSGPATVAARQVLPPECGATRDQSLQRLSDGRCDCSTVGSPAGEFIRRTAGAAGCGLQCGRQISPDSAAEPRHCAPTRPSPPHRRSKYPSTDTPGKQPARPRIRTRPPPQCSSVAAPAWRPIGPAATSRVGSQVNFYSLQHVVDAPVLEDSTDVGALAHPLASQWPPPGIRIRSAMTRPH